MAHGGRKNADDALALALASGLTVEAAAERAGVSVRTAHRRRSDPNFTNKVRQLRDALFEQAAGQMADAISEATATLRGLLTAESEPVRLRAAVEILDAALRLRENVELTGRLAVIEAALDRSPAGVGAA